MIDIIAHMTLKTLDAVDRPAHNPVEKRPSGIALVIVLITIAILSTAVVEYAHSTRINLSMSSNSADKLRSYYMARSSVNISRVLLSFQYALHDESRQAGSGEDSDDMAQLISRAMRRSNFQMYQYVDLLMKPFNSGRLESPVGGIDLKESGVEGFGEFEGNFSVEILPEEGKVDINSLSKEQISEGDLQELCAMVIDESYDSIFEQQDEVGDTLSRSLVMERLVNYIDTNTTGLELTENCIIRSQSGDENRPYDRSERDNEPRNAKLTHIDELYQVEGVTEVFMEAFKKQMTVYPVGRPNVNVAGAPIFYSVLCRNVEPQGGIQTGGGNDGEASPFNLCARDRQVRAQVLLFALALDGVRQFFSDPMSVLMAYVGTTESKLLPSAKKGQPVAFLSISQLPSYIEDFKRNPEIMAQFMAYSPTYQQLVSVNPNMQIDPLNPQFPQWTVNFDRTGLMRSVSARTPSIYRIRAKGTYDSAESTIETVIDFGKTVRRLPNEKQVTENAEDPEEIQALKEALRERQKTMPKGRVLYWREQ
jgi:type II secretory pathway component PulK